MGKESAQRLDMIQEYYGSVWTLCVAMNSSSTHFAHALENTTPFYRGWITWQAVSEVSEWFLYPSASCTTALASWIVFQSTNILTGLNVRVCVVTLRMKRVRGFSFDLLVSSAVDEHKVIKVRTSNGERYALDIAGAKFDLYTTVVPWRQYVDLHAREVLFSEDIFNA